jgi:hypothetical protein
MTMVTIDPIVFVALLVASFGLGLSACATVIAYFRGKRLG